MATITREDLIPTLIPNTTMQKIFRDGVFRQIGITPCEGYVLRDNTLDIYTELDEEGNPTGEPILGFYSGTRTVRYDYDFTANPREFCAVLIEDVPEGAGIYSLPSSDHEIM